MGNLLSNLLAMSVTGSVVTGLMLILRPVTAKIFPAKWQYGIGKMAIAFFLFPVFLFAGKLHLVQPVVESYPAEPYIIQKALPSNGFVDAMDTLMEKHLTVELMEAVLFIWLVGAMVFAGWHFYCYRRFSKQLRTDSFSVADDTATVVLLSSCKAALGIHGEVKLMLNPKIKSPMLVGVRRPMILLPTSNMQELDLKLVLAHELMHLKRKDLWVKMLALLAGTVHWFNPLVHVLRKDVSTWGELSCDEALACDMSNEERKHYGEAILNTLDNHSGINTAFCSSLCESKKHIERRLTMLLNVKKMKKHVALFAVVVIVAIAGIGTAVSALAADNTLKADSLTRNPFAPIMNSEVNVAFTTDTPVIIGSIDGLKEVELKGDGKEYTFEEFKQWLEAARLEAAELVKIGIWTQEQADKKLALYENTLADIEQKGGKTFGKMIDKGDEIFPETVDVFYTADELVFELPAKLADTANGEVGFGLSVQPKK
ncbi:M56 family metallopeptidase [Syntrophomonas wolfei]|jgi:beta-lactamase regulating signal transducer with metallopeptidase domain|uniref:M56 family metallopeptidase n=1 Tax=Syntrophomonas wolfei TaxID=863 RepID=UPI000773A868|nr:M56 family metallopeptidase [Syntrophomonas wolfei]